MIAILDGHDVDSCAADLRLDVVPGKVNMIWLIDQCPIEKELRRFAKELTEHHEKSTYTELVNPLNEKGFSDREKNLAQL